MKLPFLELSVVNFRLHVEVAKITYYRIKYIFSNFTYSTLGIRGTEKKNTSTSFRQHFISSSKYLPFYVLRIDVYNLNDQVGYWWFEIIDGLLR